MTANADTKKPAEVKIPRAVGSNSETMRYEVANVLKERTKLNGHEKKANLASGRKFLYDKLKVSTLF